MNKLNYSRREKIDLIKALASGQIKPELLKPKLIIRGWFFVDDNGVWTNSDGKVIDVINDDLRGYFEKLYPNNTIELYTMTII